MQRIAYRLNWVRCWSGFGRIGTTHGSFLAPGKKNANLLKWSVDAVSVHLAGLEKLELLELINPEFTSADVAQLRDHELAPPPLLPPVRVRLPGTRC